MAKKIEILENTLLKLLVRRGSDNDRQQILLSEGELGYTTDSKRLFIGDASTSGGIVVGNKYKNAVADHTTVLDAVEGDYVVNTTNNTLYIKTTSSWIAAGRVLVAGDGTIVVDDAAGTISVGTLSAANISTDMLGNSIMLDENSRISLSGSRISTDSIRPNSTEYLNLPQKLDINSVEYTFPIGGLSNNTYLRTDVLGNLTWSPQTQSSTFFFNSSGGPIPVGTIMPYVEASGAPEGWLLCNGQEVAGVSYPQLSAVIGETFGSTNIGVSFKLPDYINSSLYGVGSAPASSTTFSVASGLNSSLSAQGTLFIIKSVADSIASSTVTIQSGLSAVVGGVEVTGTAINPLTGDMVIGIDPRSNSSKDTNAGGSGDSTSSTFWFDDPVEIFNQTALGGVADYSFNMVFSPTLFSYDGTTYTDTGVSVPSIASAIIINAYVFDDATQKFQNTELVYAKNETKLLDSTKHYRIMSSYGIPKNYDTRVASQVMLPLSANVSTNQLVGAFKYKSYTGQQISLNAIGYII